MALPVNDSSTGPYKNIWKFTDDKLFDDAIEKIGKDPSVLCRPTARYLREPLWFYICANTPLAFIVRVINSFPEFNFGFVDEYAEDAMDYLLKSDAPAQHVISVMEILIDRCRFSFEWRPSGIDREPLLAILYGGRTDTDGLRTLMLLQAVIRRFIPNGVDAYYVAHSMLPLCQHFLVYEYLVGIYELSCENLAFALNRNDLLSKHVAMAQSSKFFLALGAQTSTRPPALQLCDSMKIVHHILSTGVANPVESFFDLPAIRKTICSLFEMGDADLLYKAWCYFANVHGVVPNYFSEVHRERLRTRHRYFTGEWNSHNRSLEDPVYVKLLQDHLVPHLHYSPNTIDPATHREAWSLCGFHFRLLPLYSFDEHGKFPWAVRARIQQVLFCLSAIGHHSKFHVTHRYSWDTGKIAVLVGHRYILEALFKYFESAFRFVSPIES